MHSSNGHKVALSSSSQCVTNLQGKSGSVDGQRKPQLSLHVSSHIPDEGLGRFSVRPGTSATCRKQLCRQLEKACRVVPCGQAHTDLEMRLAGLCLVHPGLLLLPVSLGQVIRI